MGYGLALHTTSPQLGLAIAPLNQNGRVQTWDLGRSLSAELQVYLSNFVKPLRWGDFSFIAVAKGPGGFTGTRIGVVAARTLAQQLEIPLFAISTLAAVARSRAPEMPNGLLAVQMAASRGQLFAGIYRQSSGNVLEVCQPDRAIAPDAWQQVLEQLDADYQLIEAPENLGATVTGVLSLAQQKWQEGKRPHWSEALPYYGQHPVG